MNAQQKQELLPLMSTHLLELFQAGFEYGIKAGLAGRDMTNKGEYQKEALIQIETSAMGIFSSIYKVLAVEGSNQ